MTRPLFCRESTPHMLLAAACAEPLSAAELAERLWKRDRYVRLTTIREAARLLTRQKLFRVAGTRHARRGKRANLYVLTPRGEDALDTLGRAW